MHEQQPQKSPKSRTRVASHAKTPKIPRAYTHVCDTQIPAIPTRIREHVKRRVKKFKTAK